ncbi:hypothetical protein OBBRIDRAFT_796454 [Obba rivulosa]|uniref:Zn(2)-C6 fungal-type domain-containing protein n=1 Tax=Obba rivulosa TaxID=1052685 RepID=A0A8E2ARS9_9APHY|nr:hypothetical protein OBBRIDRAFT_796454 [Obba rivulosa]
MAGAGMSTGLMHMSAPEVGFPAAAYDSSSGGSSMGYTSNAGTHWTQQFSEVGPSSAASQASTWLMPNGRVRPVPRGQACDACADKKRKGKCWRFAPGEPCLYCLKRGIPCTRTREIKKAGRKRGSKNKEKVGQSK